MNEVEFEELNAKMQRYANWFIAHGCNLIMCFDDGVGCQAVHLWFQHDNIIVLEYQQGKVQVIIDE